MATQAPRTLIVTLPLDIVGGVATKARLLGDVLADWGHDVTMASYARRRGSRESATAAAEGGAQLEVGCRFPELEFTYTASSERWRRVLSEFDRIIAVGGTPLIAHPVLQLGQPHGIWCADDVDGDRRTRQAAMSLVRRGFDKAVIAPVLRGQQARVMAGPGLAMGVSRYTVERLRRHRPGRPDDVVHLPIPVDTDFFTPPADWSSSRRLGFAGRIADPRKNAGLLFDAVKEINARGAGVSLWIAGPRDEDVERRVHASGLEGQVKFCGVLSREALRDFYRGLDLLVIPSDREGFAIAGVEAMACGAPVISTRCGGPEDYVEDARTGFLTGSDAKEIAHRADQILGSPKLRQDLSGACRETATARYSIDRFRDNLSEVWRRIWNESAEAAGRR